MGAALLAGGEYLSASLRQFSGALSGAGLATLFVCAYAGYTTFDFYPAWCAILLVCTLTVGGMLQALRHDVEAIAGLASIGAFLAPPLVFARGADPSAILIYALVLNLGLGALRARKGWRSLEAIAWIGTPVVTAEAMMGVKIGESLFFLVTYVALFAVRPRVMHSRAAPLYTYALAGITLLVSLLLFEQHQTEGWAWFAGGLGAIMLGSAWLGARRNAPETAADLRCGALAMLAGMVEGLEEGAPLTIGIAALAALLLLAPRTPLLRTHAKPVGTLLALLGAAVVLAESLDRAPPSILVFAAAAGALLANRSREAYWAGTLLFAIGLAFQVAEVRGADHWSTLLLSTGETHRPSSRLLVGLAFAALPAALALYRKEKRSLVAVGAYAALLTTGEALYLIDGIGQLPPGLIAGAALLAIAPWKRSIYAVAGALAVAVGFDLIPPEGYAPFLNRRAFALGGVLLAGWLVFPKRAEGRAAALLGVLLAGAELASVADRSGGVSVWRHLHLDLVTSVGALPFFNARFLFLAAASATVFLFARRYRKVSIAGHIYAATAMGAELVGLVLPPWRHDPWHIFSDPGEMMGAHLTLTGVILCYGTGLVVVGVRRGLPLMRHTGLALLLVGGLKVSLIDLTALGDLYRAGSFVVLGGTFLLGSYAYYRWMGDPLNAQPPLTDENGKD